ncbi:hypothetical protein [Crenothrix polyspora]|uniref:Transmembrane protein n=1 Tax=Crenothrix polyspora TaxID=360316 RepID=A0A1R4HE45_9GAMM|nr:hypothetical protein [Crenothrix polyspora]SJM94486.1 conserved hypothetical protein [Crenothrix polyspora]
MNSNTPPSTEDDEAFDLTLQKLYRSALFDEKFQQQVAADLRALPPQARAKLNAADRAFMEDADLPDALAKKLMAMTCGCKPKPWWKKLFSFNFDMGNFLSPAFSVPVSLMAGVLLGVLLPKFMQPNTSFESLGGDTPEAVQHATLGEIAKETKDDPKQWLSAIADLVRQGKASEAQKQLQEFGMRYPGYSTSE